MSTSRTGRGAAAEDRRAQDKTQAAAVEQAASEVENGAPLYAGAGAAMPGIGDWVHAIRVVLARWREQLDVFQEDLAEEMRAQIAEEQPLPVRGSQVTNVTVSRYERADEGTAGLQLRTLLAAAYNLHHTPEDLIAQAAEYLYGPRSVGGLGLSSPEQRLLDYYRRLAAPMQHQTLMMMQALANTPVYDSTFYAPGAGQTSVAAALAMNDALGRVDELLEDFGAEDE